MPIDDPLLTIVIPTFKRPRELKRCLNSLVRQKDQRFNVIVSNNDVSTDLLKLKDDFLGLSITLVNPGSNIGSIPNFNYGVSRVSTRYVTMISDDDFLYPTYVSTFYSEFEMRPNMAFYGQRCVLFDQNGKFLAENFCLTPGVNGGGPACNLMLNEKLPNTWSAYAFDMKIFREMGGVPTDVGPYADGLFLYRFVYENVGVFSDSLGAVLVSHSQNVSSRLKKISGDATRWNVNSVAYAKSFNFFDLGRRFNFLHCHGNSRHQIEVMAGFLIKEKRWRKIYESPANIPLFRQNYPVSLLIYLMLIGCYPIIKFVKLRRQMRTKISSLDPSVINEARSIINE